MEAEIKNGDYLCTASGALQTICGEAELLQRAAQRLCARRGAFVYCPDFGSRLGRLQPGAGANARALLWAQEALAPLAGQVQLLSAQTLAGGTLVRLQAGSTTRELVVPYSSEGVYA